MTEAAISRFLNCLRSLFAVMLKTCDLSSPSKLWLNHRDLSEDFLYQLTQFNTGMNYNDEIFNKSLLDLEDMFLNLGGTELRICGLPQPHRNHIIKVPREVVRETSYNLVTLDSYVEKNEGKL